MAQVYSDTIDNIHRLREAFIKSVAVIKIMQQLLSGFIIREMLKTVLTCKIYTKLKEISRETKKSNTVSVKKQAALSFKNKFLSWVIL